MKTFVIGWFILWIVWAIVIAGLIYLYRDELYKKGILDYTPDNPSNNDIFSFALVLTFLPLTGPIFIIAIKRFLEQ